MKRPAISLNKQAQKAYEHYCEFTNWKSLVSGASLPQWVDLKEPIRKAWIYTTEQTIEDVMKTFRNDLIFYFLEDYEELGLSN